MTEDRRTMPTPANPAEPAGTYEAGGYDFPTGLPADGGSAAPQGGAQSVRQVIETIEGAASEVEETSVGDVVSALGTASFPPLLMAPALAVTSPLSGIPLFSSFSGILIALIAGQMALGRRQLWLPGWLMRRKVKSAPVLKAAAWIHRPADWLDRHTGPRLRFMVAPPMDRLIHVVCLFCGLGMPMAEVIPFTSSVLGAAVLVLSLGLLVRDGVVALFGLGVIALAFRLAYVTLQG